MLEGGDEEVPVRPPVEPETVTLEAFLEAMKALQHLQSLEDLQENPDLRKAVRMALCTVTPERIICALDKASGCPEWWQTNRLHVFCPAMTHAEIAAFLNMKKNQVKHYINHAEIPADTYKDLPPIPQF